MPYYLTKFEKTKILGQRADEIAKGAPTLIDITGYKDAMSIAERELVEKKIPFIVIRHFPNGESKKIPLSEFTIE